MASDDLLDADAGGMVGKDKGNPIVVAGRNRRCEGVNDGSDPVEGPLSGLLQCSSEAQRKLEAPHLIFRLGTLQSPLTTIHPPRLIIINSFVCPTVLPRKGHRTQNINSVFSSTDAAR
eukprot:g15960.t1